MAAQNPVQPEEVVEKVFRIVVIGTVLFVCLTVAMLAF